MERREQDRREIHVAPDRFEVTAEDAILTTELHSAVAVCMYDAAEEAGALLHLRCIVKTARPVDVTDTTLATELLLVDRCLEALREAAPAARQLQARIVAHLAESAHARPVCETVMNVVRHYLTDAGVRMLPEDVAAGPARSLRFRPGMGWVHTRA
jgi:chemotaxis receptor (MCP) glutamine deamidase CheD